MAQYFLDALKGLLTVEGIIYVVLGSLAGVILGAIPGLGSSTLIVVLLPISYKLNPAMTMALFISIVIGSMSGGCIGSILLLRQSGTDTNSPNRAIRYGLCPYR